MRTIKFRGKRPDTMEWTVGSLVECFNGKTGIVSMTKYSEENGIEAIIDEVFPDTIGQYTGLKDKNGEEIYEGDILSDGRLFHIKWDSRGASWTGEMNNDPEQQLDLCFLITRKQTHVIGNIYDNPELLKGVE